MSLIRRFMLTLLCFFAAIACYVFGIAAGGVFFMLLGLVFEGLFWLGIFKRGKPKGE